MSEAETAGAVARLEAAADELVSARASIEDVGEPRVQRVADAYGRFDALLDRYRERASGSGRETFKAYVEFEGKLAEFVEELPQDLHHREAFEAAEELLDRRRLEERDFDRARDALAPVREVAELLDERESAVADYREARHAVEARRREVDANVDDLEAVLAFDDIDFVIHTAAMKHVDITEYNPFEAVKTNVVGLQNVIDAAIDSTVKRVLFTSSDKAVDPANTMGTTKLLGEKLITAGNKYSGRTGIRLTSVRFGNVIDSSQSVVPVFSEQIRNGGPVTLTDPEMTRFFLTYRDLIELVFSAMELTKGGEVFVYKMPSVRIEDLADAMVDVLAPKYGHDPGEIEIQVTGRRVGETLHEETMTELEATRTVENESMYAILPETDGSGSYLTHDGIDGFEPATDIVRSSEQGRKLERDEIVDLLEKGMGEVFE